MILVLLGTQKNSFERLLLEIEKCISNGKIKEEVIVQAGYTKFESAKMKIFEYISKNELEKLIKDANLIITHGGVGSIISCIKLSKKVIAVPRLKEYKEHVNDHQIQIVSEFNNSGFIKGVSHVEELEDVISKIPEFNPKQFVGNNSKMLKIITDYIDNN